MGWPMRSALPRDERPKCESCGTVLFRGVYITLDDVHLCRQCYEEVPAVRRSEADLPCACTHDGRGSLTNECQEHREIREQRDDLLAACRVARESCRDNLAKYAFKNEPALLSAFKACDKAIARAEGR